MQIKQAEFLTTVASDKILTNTKNEFAFVGRSNAGKSSLINALTNNKNLAKTGQRAGVTKNINYFLINKGQVTFVDLPGYGFHQAGKQEEEKWADILENYFQNAKNLKCVFVLVDSRVPSSQSDKDMLKYLNYYNIPFVVIGTKADKLKKNEIMKAKKELAFGFALGESNVILTSSQNRDGLREVLAIMDQFLIKKWVLTRFFCYFNFFFTIDIV